MKVGLRFFPPKMDGCEKKFSSKVFEARLRRRRSGWGRDNSLSQYALEMSCSTKSQISSAGRVPFFWLFFGQD